MADRVLTCTAYNETTGECAVEVWVEQSSVLPPLTLEQGVAIGNALFVALVAVAIVKVAINPRTHNRS